MIKKLKVWISGTETLRYKYVFYIYMLQNLLLIDKFEN